MSKSSWKLKIEEIAKRDRMEKKTTNDWKDLDIKDIPGDFFVNDGYEVEILQNNGDYLPSFIPGTKSKIAAITNITERYQKYRYRLKPLEPIRITMEFLQDFNKGSHLSCGNNEKISFLERRYNRKVEII